MCFNVSNFETSKPPMATLLGTITDIPFKRRPFWVDDFPDLRDMFSGSLLPGNTLPTSPRVWDIYDHHFQTKYFRQPHCGEAKFVRVKDGNKKHSKHTGGCSTMFVGFPFKNTQWPNGTWNRTCFCFFGKRVSTYLLFERPLRVARSVLTAGCTGVSKIHSGFTKTRDHQNPWDSSSTQPFLEQPLEPSEADPGLTSDQMTFPDLPLHGLRGRKDYIIP